MNKDALLNIVEHIIGQSKIFLGTKKGGFNLGVDKFNNDLNLLLVNLSLEPYGLGGDMLMIVAKMVMISMSLSYGLMPMLTRVLKIIIMNC